MPCPKGRFTVCQPRHLTPRPPEGRGNPQGAMQRATPLPLGERRRSAVASPFLRGAESARRAECVPTAQRVRVRVRFPAVTHPSNQARRSTSDGRRIAFPIRHFPSTILLCLWRTSCLRNESVCPRVSIVEHIAPEPSATPPVARLVLFLMPRTFEHVSKCPPETWGEAARDPRVIFPPTFHRQDSDPLYP